LKRRKIELYGVKTNNLKNIDVQIEQNAVTVLTGVSGSGKSSLAFDTLFAEGQRRFLESMSTYARQFLDQMPKAPVARVDNILPAIALRQQSAMSHVRSTVATTSELLDFLGLLYASSAEQRCVKCGGGVYRDSAQSIHNALSQIGENLRLIVFAEINAQDETNAKVLGRLVERGYMRLWVNGEIINMQGANIDALLDMPVLPVLIDRIGWKSSEAPPARLIEAVEAAFLLGDERLKIEIFGHTPQKILSFDKRFSCKECGELHQMLRPELFDPNATLGACHECTGFGRISGVDWNKVIQDPSLSIEKDAIYPFKTPSKRLRKKRLLGFCAQNGIDTTLAWEKLPKEDQDRVKFGHGAYKGVMGFFKDLEAKSHKFLNRIALAHFRGYSPCTHCNASGFSLQARNAFLGERSIAQILPMTVSEALAHFEALAKRASSSLSGAAYFLTEILTRLRTLHDVGLGYLNLNRQSKTLSGGEMQRLHLSTGLGRGLTDTLYVLDEPTAGLHPRDSERLLSVVAGLRDMGNTIVLVEHDPDVMAAADAVIELGPGAGEYGGKICFMGSYAGLYQSDTATGRMLRQTTRTKLVTNSPKSGDCIRIIGAREHNLKNIDVVIPLGAMVCVTGVSGSGKSTLVNDILANTWKVRQKSLHEDDVLGNCDAVEGLDLLSDLVLMEQGSLGRSSRANAATMTKAYDDIRKLMANNAFAKANMILPNAFSFNTKDGRCPKCEGRGVVTIEMQFLSDLELVCDACQGKRFKSKVLDVQYLGKNIDDILNMSVTEALEFFKDTASITRKLRPLRDVGLSYIRIGQVTSSLSGGEFQRLRLATFLGKMRRSTTKPRLFIFDEPTVGLHMQDIDQLINAMRQIVEKGDSVLVVEHQQNFIAAADHVIDLGPEGGPNGGKIVFEGSPVALMRCKESYTGQALARMFEA
jgi:excinuclease ABC subunit A